jgi:fructose/tagatose bisphosphate aldolase
MRLNDTGVREAKIIAKFVRRYLMHGLRNALDQSQKDGVAIGHFNVADWILLKAVVAAGQELKVPVVVGASEGEREFIGVRANRGSGAEFT